MRAKYELHSNGWRIALIAAALMASGCDAVNELANEGGDNTYYYVSLGTSLSVGVQPNGSGVPLPTDDGYADQLFDSIRPAFNAAETQVRELKLIRLGCPGETLDDFVNGGSCLYLAGSQLAAAVDFLTDNAGKIHLVTIDIGGNDFRNGYDDCVGTADPIGCADTLSTQIAADLAPVLAALRVAAGPDTTIIGMNYYNPTSRPGWRVMLAWRLPLSRWKRSRMCRAIWTRLTWQQKSPWLTLLLHSSQTTRRSLRRRCRHQMTCCRLT